MTFDLAQEVAALHQEESWQRGDRNAKTLVKEGMLRLTLTALKKDARLDSHVTDGTVTIQTIRGKLKFTVEGDPIELAAGQVLTLERGVRHDVTALEDSAFLITIGLHG
jgi:quercetin dioxygenase-like cupin family protein